MTQTQQIISKIQNGNKALLAYSDTANVVKSISKWNHLALTTLDLFLTGSIDFKSAISAIDHYSSQVAKDMVNSTIESKN